jgi:hypothetical protein
MDTKVHLVGLLLASLAFCGCVANSARQMQPVPSPAQLLSFNGRKAFDSADKWSFTQAVFLYQASGDDYHRIPVGDYLLGGFVNAANRYPDLSGIRLTSFTNTSRMRLGVGGRHHVSVHMQVAYQIGSRAEVFTFDHKESDVGAFYAGDWSAVPFTTGGLTMDSIFHKQINPLLDEAIMAFARELEQTEPSEGP